MTFSDELHNYPDCVQYLAEAGLSLADVGLAPQKSGRGVRMVPFSDEGDVVLSDQIATLSANQLAEALQLVALRLQQIDADNNRLRKLVQKMGYELDRCKEKMQTDCERMKGFEERFDYFALKNQRLEERLDRLLDQSKGMPNPLMSRTLHVLEVHSPSGASSLFAASFDSEHLESIGYQIVSKSENYDSHTISELEPVEDDLWVTDETYEVLAQRS